MFRYFSRCLLISLIAVTALVGSVGHLGSTAAQEPQFSAASATPVEQGGVLGKIYLSTFPWFCLQYSTPYKNVAVARPEYPSIAVTAQPGVASQQVGVQTALAQVLPSGEYQVLKTDSNEVFATVTQTYPVAIKAVGLFSGLKPGPDFVIFYLVNWYSPNNSSELTGQAAVIHLNYLITVDGGFVRDDAPVCGSYWKPEVKTSATAGTVNSTLKYTLAFYPLETLVSVKWDGATIASAYAGYSGTGTGSLRIPAAPMGTHKLTFSTGHWVSSANFTVKPRIKLIPTTGLKRGQTVNVSLRGYAKYETVRIRWKKGTSWVELARVTTSGTGSANVYIKVPTFAVDGYNSVRGDGTYGRAQTNAVYVTAGSTAASATQPTATPTKTATPEPTSTTVVATATPEPTTTAAPTEQPTTPEATETATPQPTETATPEATPDETATAAPGTETPTPEPTAEATAESSPGAEAPGEDAG